MQYLIAYMLVLGFIAFSVCGFDKLMAVKGKRRVPEKRLFALAALGGSLGLLLGMRVFRHKTRHKSFTVGVPLIIVLQPAAVFAVWYFFLKG